jgi:hypothetical protein
VQLPDMPGRDLRRDPSRASRKRRCAAANAEQDIIIHWRGRDQANLVEITPGVWAGPCPRCARFRVLRVQVGRNGDVVWTVTGQCKHTREDVYPNLANRVPCAPNPAAGQHQHNPEVAALKDTIRDLVMNERFTHSSPIKLAILEALGASTDDALDALGIIDAGNRRRARLARDKALSPAKTVTSDSRRRSKASKAPGSNTTPKLAPGRPADTRLPADTVTSDSVQPVTSDSRRSMPKQPLTSTNNDLTTRAKVVSGPAGTATHTELDLELLRSALGAEVIATEPRTSPLPVADSTEAWTPAEEGPCTRCGTRICRYGDHGSPLCADCRGPETPDTMTTVPPPNAA